MKNLLFILFLIIFTSCQQEPQQSDTNSMEMDDLLKENLQLKREQNNNDSVVNSYASYINSIRLNLQKIREQENLIISEKKDPENLTIDNTDLIQEIKIIGNLMQENKRMIEHLKSGMKNADLQLDEFEKMIISLSEEVQIKNMEIYYLQEELENMDASLGELFDAYNEKVAELEDVKDQLNKAWYAYGTKDELFKNGVITKEGGFIGIGRSTVLKDDFNKSYFREVKINDLKEIKLGVKSANLITSHPSDSYELVMSETVEKIKILDHLKFWSTSKYLVIIVK